MRHPQGACDLGDRLSSLYQGNGIPLEIAVIPPPHLFAVLLLFHIGSFLLGKALTSKSKKVHSPRDYLIWLFHRLPTATNQTVADLTPAAFAKLQAGVVPRHNYPRQRPEQLPRHRRHAPQGASPDGYAARANHGDVCSGLGFPWARAFSSTLLLSAPRGGA